MDEAIRSVLNQSYKNIQLIVVDDASTDKSVSVIKTIIKENTEIIFISIENNVGNCAAFNRGLALAHGEFIIDFAADDMLLKNRIERGVTYFEKATYQDGVQFSDAELINEEGEHLRFHSDRFTHQVPQGNIYKDLISSYFINGPSMMVRRKVFDALGGYDEKLSYEDFDFWIRSSREFNYAYIPEALVKTRIVKSSMSQQQFKRAGAQLKSTFEVCKKIMNLNRNRDEQQRLDKRILYEIKVCIKLLDFALAIRYAKLWIENSKLRYKD